MKINNIRQMIAALAGVGIITVAGVSTVACNSPSTAADMDATVLKDLGLGDGTNSTVTASLKAEGDKLTWEENVKLSDITAANLLDNKIAKSEASFNFLTGTLKLKANGDGNWEKKTFNEDEAKKVTLTTGDHEISLALTGDKKDYGVKEGSVAVEWKNGETSLGKFKVNFKADLAKGIVVEHVTVTPTDIEAIKGFHAGQSLTGFKKGDKIINDKINWKEGLGSVKLLKKLLNLTKLDLQLFVESDLKTDPITENDKLQAKIVLGKITTDKSIEVTAPAAKN